jgi:thiol-disulfide isomerase/thioredoxin
MDLKLSNMQTEHKLIIGLLACIVIYYFVFKKKEHFKTVKLCELNMFGVSTCPHCVNAKPMFNKLIKKLNKKRINNYKVSVRYIDCNKNEQLAKQYKINGVPTFVLTKCDGSKIYYNGQPTEDGLMKFVNNALNNKN